MNTGMEFNIPSPIQLANPNIGAAAYLLTPAAPIALLPHKSGIVKILSVILRNTVFSVKHVPTVRICAYEVH
ncbi:MAG: hypothetical protein FWE00_00845 [Defluviitaleaceae bacterium]|nr:hypothetical protein [Defluviitaleaceae bacterium]